MNIQFSSSLFSSLVLCEHGIDELWKNFLDSPTYIFGSTYNFSSKLVYLYFFVVVCIGSSVTSPNIALGT